MQLNNTTDLLQSKGIKKKKVTQTDEYVFIEAETEHPGKEHLWRKKKTNGIGNWQDLLYSKFNIKRKW